MNRRALPTTCALLLWLGGCPKRQSGTRLVYVPSPPPAAQPATAETAEALIIEEPPPPPPPEPVLSLPTDVPGQAALMPRRRRSTAPGSGTEEEAAPAPAAPAETLNLELRGQQPSSLERQVQELVDRVERRIALLPLELDSSDRKTLEDARAFLAQSNRARSDGDWQRARVLAQKASLLVSALEQR